MRRFLILTAVLLIACLSLVIVKPLAQQPLVDKERSRQELDTMKGIIGTSLNYALKGMEKSTERGRIRMKMFGPEERIDAYYLYGQGAVFVIPASSVGGHFGEEFAAVLAEGFGDPEMWEDLAVEVTEATTDAMAGLSGSQLSEQEKKDRAAKAEAKAAERKQRIEQRMQEQKARIQQQRENVAKRREEMKKKQEQLQQRIEQIKTKLVDTLASHGDSLTVVKPNEFVTVIISSGNDHFHLEEFDDVENETSSVVSVKKSVVTDFKAGKISREEFNRQVLQYSY